MIVSVISLKALHNINTHAVPYIDELLLFCSKSIINLVQKVENIEEKLMDKIL